MKWSNEYKIHYYYTDYNNILKPSYIARYMQETAWNALKNWGPTPEYLRENNLAFILSKISFKYYEEIYEDDIIKAETWANPAKSMIFPRHYRIYKDGRTAAEAVSAWVLFDTKEKNILRPDALDEKFIAYDGEELNFNVQRRFKMPEDMSVCSEYKVRYSDIDTYFHMNNVAYIDLICDSLYTDGDIISPELKKQVLSLDLNYNNEAKFAQTIAISKAAILNAETTEYYIRGKVKETGQNCFEAKIVTS
jgi:acyl-ACP thioesterase